MYPLKRKLKNKIVNQIIFWNILDNQNLLLYEVSNLHKCNNIKREFLIPFRYFCFISLNIVVMMVMLMVNIIL